MSIYDSKQWIDDIDCVIKVLPELKSLAGKNVLITGAAGLICSSVLDIIIRYNETHEKKIQIYAAGRNESKMKERFHRYYHEGYFHFVLYDSAKVGNIFDFSCDYIIHGAANSSPKKIIDEPVETMVSNFMGMKYLLDFAAECKADRVLFISSSEVYGNKIKDGAYSEADYGGIDILVPRNSYPVGKQAAETLCVSYGYEYGLDTVIVRPGHIYGPTANKTDDHVASAWAYGAVAGQNIVMKSDGSQIRSYVYCLDCASAILKVLLCGESGYAYNISNPDSIISIKEMATLLSRAGDVEVEFALATEVEKKGFNPMQNSSLNSERLMRLGWTGCFAAGKGFEHTVNILKELNIKSN